MRIEPFSLERWLFKNECTYDLASAGVTKIPLGDLVDAIPRTMKMTYGSSRGSEELRAEIAALFADAGQDNVLVTNGTAEANFLLAYMLLERGDELVVQLPNYLQVAGIAKSLGVRVRTFHADAKMGYELDPDLLKNLITAKTKMIYITNPNNPTGTILSEATMQAICQLAGTVGAYVLCDGALRGSEAGGDLAPTPVGLYERGIATGSLSKLGLSGLRIGWVVASAEVVDACWVYKDYTTLSHSGISEHLATIALERETIARLMERTRGIVRDRRDILTEWMQENGRFFDWTQPEAGHTAFLRLRLDVDSVTLSLRLVDDEGVLIAPGEFFGSPGHVRVRYSLERGSLEEALRRTSQFLGAYEPPRS